MRNAASKVMSVERATLFMLGLAVILALVFGVTSTAFAHKGDKGFFHLGHKNVAKKVSTLVKRGAGPALNLQVGSGPPLAVNSSEKVANLNADQLDGKNSSEFAASSHPHSGEDITSGTVAEARIDGSIARDNEIMPTVTANGGQGSGLDADKLDGQDSSAFFTGATYLIRETKMSAITADATISVQCDTGDKALSGGLSDLDPPNSFVISNRPDPNTAGGSPTGWFVSWRNTIAPDEATGYAVCADLPPARTS